MLGAKIKQIRELKGYTQEDIAKALHITTQAYSRIEREEVSLSVERLEQIGLVLGVNGDFIVNFSVEDIFKPRERHNERVVEILASVISQQYAEINYLRGELKEFRAYQKPKQNE